ncbi:hypothetical protein ACHAWO_001850 [Cyclotella atomus]|uniref:Uncharacterized protein n=1 Tax=Cyclotella atomus TaxID=382360 RepID=A0ABD3QXG2_9STRA
MYRHLLLLQSRQLLPTPRPTPHIHQSTTRPHSDQPSRRPRPHQRPHYTDKHHPLIPQAYRRRPDDTAKHSSNLHSKKRRKRINGIAFSPALRFNQKIRRKKSAVVSLDTLLSIEAGLSIKLKGYNDRLMGVQDFATTSLMYNQKEERERDFPSLSTHNQGYDTIDTLNAMDISGLYGTEELYTEITSEFQSLIIGYCDVAEGICGSKRLENMVKSSPEEDSNSNHSNGNSNSSRVERKEYEEMVGKAEGYLEALESFCRNRVEAVKKGKKMVEEGGISDGSGGHKMLENVGSFLRGVFTGNNQSEFDEAWKGADGSKKEPQVGPITLENFDDFIRAHKNEDSYPDIALYEHMLSANTAAYAFGKQAKVESVERSNRLLTRWISLHCLQSKSNNDPVKTREVETLSTASEVGDSEYDDTKYPEQRLFHIVMRQNADLWSLEGSQRVEEWLRRMESLHQDGHVQFAPDVHAYNLVLLSYCNLCKNSIPPKPQAGGSKSRSASSSFDDLGSHNISQHVRKYILHGAENILLELGDSSDVDPNVLSLNLALNAIAKAGKNESDICAKTDRLLTKVLGQDKFDSLIDESVQDAIADSDELEPDLDTYHWLVNIYSGGNLFYIKRTMLLLEKMIKMRIAIGDDDDDIIAPSTGTFNNALRALQCKVDELSRLTRMGDVNIAKLSEATRQELQNYSPIDIAKVISPMIDAMVQFESAMPTRVTFLMMLQIWSRTKSKEAGDRAEELLSRMEALNSYNSLMPFSNAYTLVLRNWLTSAEAGRIGAVERAHRLLEIIEAQTGDANDAAEATSEDLLTTAIGIATDKTEEFNEFHIYDRSIYDYSKLYPMMLRICATYTGKEDTARAVDIAFQTCEKMMSRRTKPSGKAFELLYTTVDNYLRCHPGLPEYEKKKLKDRVFSLAEQNKVSKGELIGRWQQVQLRAEAADVNEEDDSEI